MSGQLAGAITGRARVPITVTVAGQRLLPPDVQVALYCIVQEALNNVAKHAGASRSTAKSQASNIPSKLGVSSCTEAVALAPQHNLLD